MRKGLVYVGHRTHFSVLSAQGHTGLLRKAARAGVLPWAHLAPAATGHWGILLGSAGAQWGGRGRAGHVLRALGPRAQALGSSPEMSGQPLVCTLLSSGTSASPEGCAWRVTLLCHLGSPGIIQYLSVCVWPAPLTRLSSSSIRVAAHRSF